MKRNTWIALGAAAVGGALLLRATRRRDTLAGKVVLITGGSRGLGFEVARRCVERGARVAVLSRDAETVKRAAEVLGHGVLPIACDVGDEAGMRRAVTAVTAHFGRVDVLMHVAGRIVVGPEKTMDVADYRTSVDAHLFGAIHGVRAVLPQMRARKDGRIVLISSIGGRMSLPHLVPYSAGKFALVGYGEGLHSELAPEGINVTTVCPGLMRTGSPRNADFKGDHRGEYTWFAVADSLPGISISARTAACRIVDACELRKADLMMMPMGTPLLVFKLLFPEAFAWMFELTNRALPDGTSKRVFKGYDSETDVTRSAITTLTREAEQRNNEV